MDDRSQPGDEPGGHEPGGGPPRPPAFDLSQIDVEGLVRMLQSPGPVNWEVAARTAAAVAAEGDRPPDADERTALEELARAALTHVVGETGLTAAFGAPVQVLSRGDWARLHLDALRPVLEALAGALEKGLSAAGVDGPGDDDGPEPGGPSSAVPGPFGLPLGPEAFTGIMNLMAPVLLGMQAGAMIGHLAHHALGRYDLPLPTRDTPGICFAAPNLAAFEEEWSLPRDDLRFSIAIHETVRVAERSVPWVQERLVRLAVDYVSGYEIDLDAFGARFGDVDPSDPEAMQAVVADPEALLGAMETPRLRAARDRLVDTTVVLEGYADTVATRIAGRLVPGAGRIEEAVRRHRLERGDAERFIEGLLGLRLRRDDYDRGRAFCDGVVERAGLDGLNRLWESEDNMPTPAELDASGLWLARIDLPGEGA